MRVNKGVMCALLMTNILMFSFNADVKAIEFSEFYIYDISYVRQTDPYWCGPASLTMILNYWGANVTQEEVAAEIYDPEANLTSISKMRMYPQKIGFKTKEIDGSINDLKEWINRGRPLIVLQKFSLANMYGHYRVVTGYSDEKEMIVTFDPILGSNHNITYSEFAELWKPGSTFSTLNWTLIVTPENSVLMRLMEIHQLSINQKAPSNYEQTFKTEDIYLIVSAFALVLAAIGGIPQIRRWITPKPKLKIVETRIEEMPAENRNILHLEVQNEKKWWRRGCDATDVVAEWYIMDKDYEQWGATFNQVLSPYLMTGAKVSKEFSIVHRFRPEGNPHTIVVLVKCREDVRKRERITYLGS